ncbi:DUF6199 family natural product biosynthesis protein [Paenibacillus guangzhouensis]|uniref:DUF6199 family natural product biosynthesis protein n=1 Tax=Paenibacillus guangzhouensis TaxID=1473112 RepID=UPI001266D526|nr:DUF6199 family natural product biosynthesis protein [Paenibacillus guangzhouensis]
MPIFIGIIFLIIGILRWKYPAIGWRPRERWMVNRDDEPSDTYLSIARYLSFIMILAGSIFLLIGILSIF